MNKVTKATKMTKVELAIVGAGLVGSRHIDAIAQISNVNVSVVVDTSDAAKQLAADIGVPYVNSLQDLFLDHKPDGVLLATPTPMHVEQGLQCIEHNCPVLIEKPVAVTASDAARLVDAAAKKAVPILVGHHRRHNPLIQKAKALIEAGEIGDIRSAQGTCWLYKPDDYFDVAPWRKKYGAGPISVNLIHDVDTMRFLMGDVVQVQASATKSVRGYENEDVAAAVLTFANGAIATISVSDSIVSPWSWELTAQENPAYAPTTQNCLMIGGSMGSMSIPDLTVWTHKGKRSWWSPIAATTQPRESSDPLINQIIQFSKVIKGQANPLVSGLEGMKTLQVIEAIQTAAQEGRAVLISNH